MRPRPHSAPGSSSEKPPRPEPGRAPPRPAGALCGTGSGKRRSRQAREHVARLDRGRIFSERLHQSVVADDIDQARNSLRCLDRCMPIASGENGASFPPAFIQRCRMYRSISVPARGSIASRSAIRCLNCFRCVAVEQVVQLALPHQHNLEQLLVRRIRSFRAGGSLPALPGSACGPHRRSAPMILPSRCPLQRKF